MELALTEQMLLSNLHSLSQYAVSFSFILMQFDDYILTKNMEQFTLIYFWKQSTKMIHYENYLWYVTRYSE